MEGNCRLNLILREKRKKVGLTIILIIVVKNTYNTANPLWMYLPLRKNQHPDLCLACNSTTSLCTGVGHSCHRAGIEGSSPPFYSSEIHRSPCCSLQENCWFVELLFESSSTLTLCWPTVLRPKLFHVAPIGYYRPVIHMKTRVNSSLVNNVWAPCPWPFNNVLI